MRGGRREGKRESKGAKQRAKPSRATVLPISVARAVILPSIVIRILIIVPFTSIPTSSSVQAPACSCPPLRLSHRQSAKTLGQSRDVVRE